MKCSKMRRDGTPCPCPATIGPYCGAHDPDAPRIPTRSELQAEIARLRAENRTLRRGSRTLGEIIAATNRDLAELVGWEIDEDQDSVEWAAAWDQLREMRSELFRLRAELARLKRDGCYPAPRIDWVTHIVRASSTNTPEESA